MLPAAQCLEHLNLRDCRVSDRACALLAAYAPSLQWLRWGAPLASARALASPVSLWEPLLPPARSFAWLFRSIAWLFVCACHRASRSGLPALPWLVCCLMLSTPPRPPPCPCSLEHCPRVSKQGLACLAAGLPLLRELHLVGTAVPSEAAAQLRATPRGRRLRISTFKHCWWVPPAPLDGEGGQPVAGAGPQ